MKSIWKVFSFALVFNLASASTLLFASASAPEITHEELKKLVESPEKAKSFAIIDANSEKSYAEGHIPTAISYAKNDKNLSKVLPKDKNTLIVAYCGGPMCTAWQDAAKEAEKLGYTNIKHYKGGLEGWKKSKSKLEPAKS